MILRTIQDSYVRGDLIRNNLTVIQDSYVRGDLIQDNLTVIQDSYVRGDLIRNKILSDVRQANAEDTRSVVWNHVETYTVNMTPRAYTLKHFRNRNLSIIISFVGYIYHVSLNNSTSP